MSLKIKLAKVWILFVLLLGGVVITPVSSMVVTVEEQAIAGLFTAGQPGPMLMGECDSGSSCGT